MAADEEVSACYARQWLRFGVGETEGLDADCYSDALTQGLRENDMGLQSPLLAILATPHFTARVGEAGELDVPGLDRVPLGIDEAPAVIGVEEPPDNLEDVACGTPPPVTGGVVGDGALTVSVSEDRWASGYNRYVTVTNTGEEAVNGWVISMQVDGTITNAWNVERDGDTGTVIFSNVVHNGLLTPGAAAQFGFGASLDGNQGMPDDGDDNGGDDNGGDDNGGDDNGGDSGTLDCTACTGCIFATNNQCYTDVESEAACLMWAGNQWCGE